MPRPLRQSLAGGIYHVLNRANAGLPVFSTDEACAEFIDLLAAASERLPTGLLAWCLMPNHFHLVVQPRQDGGLSPWMQWLMTAHVRRHHRRTGSWGHVWQGRYRSFPIQDDSHLLTVLRYVERNPLRAGLVARAEDWRWSSLREPWPACLGPCRTASPVDRGADWLTLVNAAETDEELAAVRLAAQRGQPYGEAAWQREAARRHGLDSTLRPRGRPRRETER